MLVAKLSPTFHMFQLTWADIYVFYMTEAIAKLNPSMIEAGFPKLAAHRRAVLNDPRMARYLSQRA